MKTHPILTVFLSAVLFTSIHCRAGMLDNVESMVSGTNGSSGALSSLTDGQVADGLKEALGNGVAHAVASLGHNNGFLTNLNVRIPLPGKLQSVEKLLRKAGENKLVDDFEGSMNHAAEQAVPVASDIFGDAIKQMSITDAKNILTGPDDAATQYFRRTTQTNLFTAFYPIVQKATDQVGVTEKYKAMMAKFNSLSSLQSFGSLLGKNSDVLGTTDLDTYVTNKGLDGLFKMVAAEEKNIRANPAARSTDLLKSVFGATQQ
jgi:hypothetical protein